MIEIRFHGRGGQGTVVASKILADAFFREGKYVQAFPQFGVERRGAPVTAFLRVGDKNSLFVRSFIYQPDHLVILDPTLLNAVNVLDGLKPNGWVIVNTSDVPDSLNIPKEYRVATVDANAIAVKHKLGKPTAPIVNTAILGAFVRATGLLSLDSLIQAIKDGVPIAPDANAKAAEEAFNNVALPQEFTP